MNTCLACFVLFGVFSLTLAFSCTGTRTTEQLRNLFIGRCLDFQFVMNPPYLCPRAKNCTKLWEYFIAGFAYEPPCDVNKHNYMAFMDASMDPPPPHMNIFWSNVYDLVSRFTGKGRGREFISLTNTLPGYIGDNLSWCGNSNPVDGIEEDYLSCPPYAITPTCKSSSERAFWTLASEYYARQASGKIYIMMNAAKQPSFFATSTFATAELPNIDPSRVHEADVWMVHELGQPVLETCKSPSIRILLAILESRGIHTTCNENPRDVMLMQCADKPLHEECKEFMKPKESDSIKSASMESASLHSESIDSASMESASMESASMESDSK